VVSIPIGVCVDDYGCNEAVDEAAMALAAGARVSAIACMTRSPRWPAAARALGRACAQADLGLHLDLTEWAAPRVRRPLGCLILAACAHWLDPAALREEIRAQLDAFEAALGMPPAFVDGHQHVHQLPGVREALLAELARRGAARRTWLRSTRPIPRPLRARFQDGSALKHGLIAALGGRRFQALARAGGHALNAHLLGVYGFDGDGQGYACRLQGWLAQAGEADLLMCHPATRALPGDPIGPARVAEYAVLSAPCFGELLQRYGLRVERLSRVLDGSRVPVQAAVA
jgi:predicted glycoside hydrolase/deacetylase ChbG (UPF0249 family)